MNDDRLARQWRARRPWRCRIGWHRWEWRLVMLRYSRGRSRMQVCSRCRVTRGWK